MWYNKVMVKVRKVVALKPDYFCYDNPYVHFNEKNNPVLKIDIRDTRNQKFEFSEKMTRKCLATNRKLNKLYNQESDFIEEYIRDIKKRNGL